MVAGVKYANGRRFSRQRRKSQILYNERLSLEEFNPSSSGSSNNQLAHERTLHRSRKRRTQSQEMFPSMNNNGVTSDNEEHGGKLPTSKIQESRNKTKHTEEEIPKSQAPFEFMMWNLPHFLKKINRLAKKKKKSPKQIPSQENSPREEDLESNQTLHTDTGQITVEGKNHPNEDRILSLCSDDFDLYAVIDGHGGDMAADYVKKNLFDFIKDHLSKAGDMPMEEVLVECILDLDDHFCSFARKSKNYSGACFVASVHYKNEVYIINLGDCRAVQCELPLSTGSTLSPTITRTNSSNLSKLMHKKKCTPTKIVQLSTDHKAHSSNEKKRIKDAGGSIVNGRLAGVLSPSRAIGDIDLKTKEMKGWLIAKPQVLKIESRGLKNKNSVIVLASDGVWDVMPNKQVLSLASQVIQQGKNSQKASELIAQAATLLDSRDDISVIVLATIVISTSPSPSESSSSEY